MNTVQYVAIDDNQVVDTLTGEVIDFAEIVKAKEQKLLEYYEEMKNESISLGVQSDLIILKYKNREYNCATVKANYTFNKEFRVELREIMKNFKLSKNARCFLGTMTPFISFPSNAILIDYRNPEYKDLMDILDFGKNVLMNTLKELEDKEIIQRVKVNGQMIIYFNPFLYCGGFCVETDVYKIFESSMYNPKSNKI